MSIDVSAIEIDVIFTLRHAVNPAVNVHYLYIELKWVQGMSTICFAIL